MVWVFEHDRTVTAVLGEVVVDLPWESIAEQVDELELPPLYCTTVTLVGRVKLLGSETAFRRSFGRVDGASDAWKKQGGFVEEASTATPTILCDTD